MEAEKREKTEKQRTAIGKAADGLTLAFINYMRFARRAQSQQKAREIFKRARTNAHCRYHIFIASGQMEFHMNKEPQIAAKVYEHCMNNVAGSNANFALEYLDFLSHRNEDNNTRAVFECVVSQVPKESAKVIFIFIFVKAVYFCRLHTICRKYGTGSLTLKSTLATSIVSSVWTGGSVNCTRLAMRSAR